MFTIFPGWASVYLRKQLTVDSCHGGILNSSGQQGVRERYRQTVALNAKVFFCFVLLF